MNRHRVTNGTATLAFLAATSVACGVFASPAHADWPQPGPAYQITSLDPNTTGTCLELKPPTPSWRYPIEREPCSTTPAQQWHASDGLTVTRLESAQNPGTCVGVFPMGGFLTGVLCDDSMPIKSVAWSYDPETKRVSGQPQPFPEPACWFSPPPRPKMPPTKAVILTSCTIMPSQYGRWDVTPTPE